MAYRFYSVFARAKGSRKWQRLSGKAFPKEQAVRIFQDVLLAGYFAYPDKEFRLRPVKDTPVLSELRRLMAR